MTHPEQTGSPVPEEGDDLNLKLAQKFAPVLRLHPEEQFLPQGVEALVENAILTYHEIVDGGEHSFFVEDVTPDMLAPDALESYKSELPEGSEYDGANWFLDVPDDIRTNPQHEYPPKIYAAVRDDDGYLYLQYHLFYFYDHVNPGFTQTECQELGLPICDPHEADWELIQLEFSEDNVANIVNGNVKPERVAYSQHGWSEDSAYEDIPNLNGHPIAYVAHGKHANYFGPDPNLFDDAADDDPWSVSASQDHISDRGSELLPPALSDYANPCPDSILGSGALCTHTYELELIDEQTPWVAYPGTWGDAKYTGPDQPARWDSPRNWMEVSPDIDLNDQDGRDRDRAVLNAVYYHWRWNWPDWEPFSVGTIVETVTEVIRQIFDQRVTELVFFDREEELEPFSPRTIPPSLGDLSHLQKLNLSGNGLTGVIPRQLGYLANLKELHLNDNQLSGEIPHTLSLLTNLRTLRLSGNHWEGCIPAELTEIPDNDLVQLMQDRKMSLCSDRTALTEPEWGRLEINPPALDHQGGIVTVRVYIHEPSDPEHMAQAPAIAVGIPRGVSIPGATNMWEGSVGSCDTATVVLQDYTEYCWRATFSGVPANAARDTVSNGNATSAAVVYEVTVEAEHVTGSAPAGSFSVAGQSPFSDDRVLLEAIYDATGGDNWYSQNYTRRDQTEDWLTQRGIGDWHGVTVDGTGKVTRLELRRNYLLGDLPDEVGYLEHLEILDLASNNMVKVGFEDDDWTGVSGQIPETLGRLGRLTRLDLSVNDLAGEIPAGLGNLQRLVELKLDDNGLSGEIPAELGNLKNLQSLDLSENSLSGQIPSELTLLSNLTELRLADNQFTGCIPASLRNVHDNDLSELDLPACEDALSAIEPIVHISAWNLDGLSDAGNVDPSGIWSDGRTMWVADVRDEKIYAYDLSAQTRATSVDFDTLDAAGNHNPSGIWSDLATMWVVDETDEENLCLCGGHQNADSQQGLRHVDRGRQRQSAGHLVRWVNHVGVRFIGGQNLRLRRKDQSAGCRPGFRYPGIGWKRQSPGHLVRWQHHVGGRRVRRQAVCLRPGNHAACSVQRLQRPG